MVKDLRSFLKEYEAKYPEDVVHIDKPVSMDQEVTGIVERFEAMDKYPLLVFDNPENAEAKKTRIPIVTNVFASRTRYARICDSPYEMLGRQVYKLLREGKRKPVVVSKKEAPVKEVIETGDEINLFKFPVTVHCAMDAGYYLSAGFVTTYDPDSGIDNCSLQRAWIKDKETVPVFISPRPMHNGTNVHKNDINNRDTKVCIWVGHHPLAYIGGLAKLPYPGSHWEAIGGALGAPLRLVTSETLGDDFLIPADAELVIEGILKANHRVAEGPFGEVTGYYGGQILSPQLNVTAVTYRKDLIMYNIVAGHVDHLGTGGPPLEGMLWDHLKPIFPSLTNVYMPISGIGRMHAYLQMKNPVLGEARQAILQALTLDCQLIKHVFVFDDDVDIFNPRDVMWAIATRTQWDRDVIVLPRIKQTGLDPSRGWDPGAIGGIDCTKPWGEPYEERVGVEPEIKQQIKLEDYVSPQAIAGVNLERV